MNNSKKNKSFFQIALRFAIIFLVFVFIIKIVFSIVKNGSFEAMQEEYFSGDRFLSFAKGLIIMSIFYGLFMAGYYKFIKKK